MFAVLWQLQLPNATEIHTAPNNPKKPDNPKPRPQLTHPTRNSRGLLLFSLYEHNIYSKRTLGRGWVVTTPETSNGRLGVGGTGGSH